ncbi:MAG: poly(A) polymerase [Chromatiales bacterium]|nr:poly(A) polymerase [Chromatiales bacterium]
MTSIRTSDQQAPLIVPRSGHSVSRANISKGAVKVLYRLKDAGHQAFLVGGGVRDLLLGRRPKDFDIATDARPEQVRALFSNSRLIGRRFRLAHIRFGREIIEVATFRGTSPAEDGDQKQVLHASGRIIADNVYGTIEEDALRRDFTVNALYYNIADYSIWVFADGLADLESRQLRLIGDPGRRYTEDPVRMLRAARFAAKLDFVLHPDAVAPIPAMASLLDDVPSARLFDEFLKMFQSGHALSSYRHLREFGLFRHLFPDTDCWLDDPACAADAAMIESALENTDQRIAAGKPVTPMFLFGVFLWRAVRLRTEQLLAESDDFSHMQALIAATAEISTRQAQRIALPRRFGFPMRDMLQLQPRFATRKGRRAMNLLGHRRFRAAYDLMLLRASSGEVDQELADFWTDIQEQPETEQRNRFGLTGRRRRSAKHRRRSGSPD